jgi:hypothetical protein
MDLLMLLEHTTPKESVEVFRRADSGGIPGGVEGRGSRAPAASDAATIMLCVSVMITPF